MFLDVGRPNIAVILPLLSADLADLIRILFYSYIADYRLQRLEFKPICTQINETK